MNPILTDLFRHNLWANLTLIDFCSGLPDRILDLTVPGTFGGIRDTLAHTAAVEERFVRQLAGSEETETAALDEEETDLATVRQHAKVSGEGLIAYAAAVEGAPLLEVMWQGHPQQVSAGLFLLQAINHATEHRAQVRTALSQAGIEPPTIDAWAWAYKGDGVMGGG